MKSRSILFVCAGNTCRSPMAEALLRHMLKKESIAGIEVFSRGVGAWPGQSMSEGAQAALKSIGITPSPHPSQTLARSDVEKASDVLVMTEAQRRAVAADYPEFQSKIRLLGSSDIRDPIGGSPNDYEKCRIDIQNALLDLLPKLKTERTSS